MIPQNSTGKFCFRGVLRLPDFKSKIATETVFQLKRVYAFRNPKKEGHRAANDRVILFTNKSCVWWALLFPKTDTFAWKIGKSDNR